MNPSQLPLSKLPFTLFFHPQAFEDKITLSTRMRDALGGVLDGESLILPVPQNGPPDVPRIQLQSRGKDYLLQITLRQLTFEWNRRRAEPVEWTPFLRQFLGLVDGVLRVFIGEYVKPFRFALNPQFLIQMGSSANEYLTNSVIQPGRVLQRPASAKISVLDQFNINGRVMNLWMNLSSARQQNNPQDDSGLVIHFDFNSAGEDTRPFFAEDLTNILAECERLMSERIQSSLKDLFKPDPI